MHAGIYIFMFIRVCNSFDVKSVRRWKNGHVIANLCTMYGAANDYSFSWDRYFYMLFGQNGVVYVGKKCAVKHNKYLYTCSGNAVFTQ